MSGTKSRNQVWERSCWRRPRTPPSYPSTACTDHRLLLWKEHTNWWLLLIPKGLLLWKEQANWCFLLTTERALLWKEHTSYHLSIITISLRNSFYSERTNWIVKSLNVIGAIKYECLFDFIRKIEGKLLILQYIYIISWVSGLRGITDAY